MSNIINTLNIPTVDYIKGNKGKFTLILKVRAGYVAADNLSTQPWRNESYLKNPSNILGEYKKGALQTVMFQPEGSNHSFVVFARVGKKIKVVDVAFLESLKVGTVNSVWYGTELYGQGQYEAVKATSWDSFAFKMNEVVEELV